VLESNAAGSPPRTGTRTEEVYQRLRRDIRRGVYAPNDRLIEVDLADELAVSRTPVREALQRLAADGLVVSKRRSWSVYQHTLAEIRNLYEARAALEGYAARLAAERASKEHLDDLATRYREGVARVEAATERPDDLNGVRSAIVDVNDIFHDDVSRAAANPWLVELIQRSRSFYFNREIARLYSKEELTRAFSDHEAILEALFEHDADRAERVARKHVEDGFAVIRERMT
jgi:DNA-binding GntR family transcriptional regulator